MPAWHSGPCILAAKNDERPAAALCRRYRRGRGPVLQIAQFFALTGGTVMPEATVAYETYGRLASDGRNAILCTHGYTASHHFAGRSPANGN
jgi:homoserine acetyltransferase